MRQDSFFSLFISSVFVDPESFIVSSGIINSISTYLFFFPPHLCPRSYLRLHCSYRHSRTYFKILYLLCIYIFHLYIHPSITIPSSCQQYEFYIMHSYQSVSAITLSLYYHHYHHHHHHHHHPPPPPPPPSPPLMTYTPYHEFIFKT